MKKLFTLALIGVFSTFLTSCSNTGTADLQSEPLNQVYQDKISAKEDLNGDEKAALAAINLEVTTIIIKGQTSEETNRVRFCNHSPWSGSEGQGYAEYTPPKGPKMYLHFAWFTDANGQPHVDAVFLGYQSFSYMGC